MLLLLTMAWRIRRQSSEDVVKRMQVGHMLTHAASSMERPSVVVSAAATATPPKKPRSLRSVALSIATSNDRYDVTVTPIAPEKALTRNPRLKAMHHEAAAIASATPIATKAATSATTPTAAGRSRDHSQAPTPTAASKKAPPLPTAASKAALYISKLKSRGGIAHVATAAMLASNKVKSGHKYLAFGKGIGAMLLLCIQARVSRLFHDPCVCVCVCVQTW